MVCVDPIREKGIVAYFLTYFRTESPLDESPRIWYNICNTYKNSQYMLSFSPKSVTKDLLAGLSDRSRTVLVDRFGLNGNEGRTLDAIGKQYNVTRERIRQIENHGIITVRDSEAYMRHSEELNEIKKHIQTLGSALPQEILLQKLSKNAQERNHLLLLLTIGHIFDTRRENNDYQTRWYVDEQLMEQVEEALDNLHGSVEQQTLIPEDEFLAMFTKHLKASGVRVRGDESVMHWLLISKRVGKNPLGEWGRTDSPHVRIKNTRDFAYLTLKRNGSPMHFTEVSRGISDLFKRKTHPATTHNELIKDPRFILVGRGLYALKEWGYEPGVVRDVIRAILAREGSLTREEIVDRVKRERYVKDATIAVNLQHNMFVKNPDGSYTLATR